MVSGNSTEEDMVSGNSTEEDMVSGNSTEEDVRYESRALRRTFRPMRE
jgi:hypothetical protein